MKQFKSGFIAIVGRPNVGKSTLLNAILNKKISITTPKPQTTRWQILGIKTTKHAQMVFVDTPGMHREEKRAMSRYLNRIASASIADADLILFVVDCKRFSSEDELVFNKLKKIDKPIILVLNKIDLFNKKEMVLPFIAKYQAAFPYAAIVPLAALTQTNLTELEKVIIDFLPQGPMLFPAEQHTDKSIKFQLAELIREKVILATEEELPYTTTIEIEDLKQEEKLYKVSAIIWVERPGQKAIVIGKAGATLKKIGMLARKDAERLLKQKVFLRLWVKVKEHWTDNEKALINLGYE